jgi:putative addiction module antidote
METRFRAKLYSTTRAVSGCEEMRAGNVGSDKFEHKERDSFNGDQIWIECYNLCVYTEGMVLELKLRKVGNSVGVVLPKEALARMNVEEGDAVFLTEATDGGFRITGSNPEFAKKMKVAESLSRRYRNALKELAK